MITSPVNKSSVSKMLTLHMKSIISTTAMGLIVGMWIELNRSNSQQTHHMIVLASIALLAYLLYVKKSINDEVQALPAMALARARQILAGEKADFAYIEAVRPGVSAFEQELAKEDISEADAALLVHRWTQAAMAPRMIRKRNLLGAFAVYKESLSKVRLQVLPEPQPTAQIGVVAAIVGYLLACYLT